MLCSKCKNKPANVHYTLNNNGFITEIHLCSDCAKSDIFIKFNEKNSLYDNSFTSLFDNWSKLGTVKNTKLICPGCGMSDEEFLSSGKFGCAECYNTFCEIANNIFLKIHQSNEYKGEFPEGIRDRVSLSRKIQRLKADMDTAVEKQEYEEAARIRDAIRQLSDIGKVSEKDCKGSDKT